MELILPTTEYKTSFIEAVKEYQAHCYTGSMKKGTGIALSIPFGVVLGVVMDNIGVGIAIGIAMGVAFEVGSRKKDDTE